MSAAIDDNTGRVFHAGEIALQRELGLADRLEEIGKRMIQRELPEQHRAFYPQLPFIIAGSVDRADDAWATLIAGEPGFMHSPQADRLVISASIDPRDLAADGLAPAILSACSASNCNRGAIASTAFSRAIAATSTKARAGLRQLPQLFACATIVSTAPRGLRRTMPSILQSSMQRQSP